MKCLSVQQPWASAIILGAKSVENRTWFPPRHIRGRILIHTGKRADNDVPDWIRRRLAEHDGLELEAERGVLLGAVDLVDVSTPDICQLDLAFGPVCWILRDPIVFREPIPLRGRLGLFDVPDDLVEQAITDAVTPTKFAADRWRERMHAKGPDPSIASADGWTGD